MIMKLAKTIIIMALSILLTLSLSYNIFLNIIFEIKDIEDVKQLMLAKELIEGLNNSSSEKESIITETESNNDTTDNIPTTESNKVIFFEEYIKITYTGCKQSLWGYELNFIIENNSNRTVSINFTDVAIDGFSTDLSGGYQDNIRPGDKAFEELILYSSDYEKFTEKPEYVEFIISVYDDDEYFTVVESNVICINI